ncbi:MAG: Ig-like domain-containing protein [Opitutaceae bacterium]|nr:Ig-like domain-containing protein [Opitutaceae bacterium]
MLLLRLPLILGFCLLAAVARASAAPTLAPSAEAKDVCPDTRLRLTFEAPAALGTTGVIVVTDVATGAAVDTIELTKGPAIQAIGGVDGFNYHPVMIEGGEVTIHLRNGSLQRGRTYAVTIAPGAFTVGGQPFAGIGKDAPWRFSTRTTALAADATRLVVAADGSGDFCTVQGALDFLPEGNTRPVTVFVKRGRYTEILCLFNKHGVTLVGEDRRGTVIAYPNNANFNGNGGNPYAGTSNPSALNPRSGGAVYRRGLLLVHQCEDFTLANLTLHNTTPQGGSQAEAIIVNGSLTARTVIRDCDFFSFQDTVQINGQAYVARCHVEGDVDFLWGRGPSFFEDCAFVSLRSGAYYTQVRNPGANRGFVFLRCRFEGAPGVKDNYLTRVEPHRFPDSEVVLVDCVLGEAVGAVGWQLQRAKGATEDPAPGQVHFWEFNSRTPSGEPVDDSGRLPASRRLREPDDAVTIARYRDAAWVLGGAWDPRTDPRTAGK